MRFIEQAGIQPYLQAVSLSLGVDAIEARYMDVLMGDHLFEVDTDVQAVANPSNLVVDTPILDLDPAGLSPVDFSTPGVRFVVGDEVGEGEGRVGMPEIGGIDGFDVSTRAWYEQGGTVERTVHAPPFPPHTIGVLPDPDAVIDGRLPGSGAYRWTDYPERMWTISRIFEQTHTDRSLYATDRLNHSIGNLEVLDDGVELGG